MFQSILEFQCHGALKFIEFFKDIKQHNWSEFVYLFLLLTVTNLAVIVCLILATSYIIIHFTVKFFYDIFASITNIHKPGDVRDGINTGSNSSN